MNDERKRYLVLRLDIDCYDCEYDIDDPEVYGATDDWLEAVRLQIQDGTCLVDTETLTVYTNKSPEVTKTCRDFAWYFNGEVYTHHKKIHPVSGVEKFPEWPFVYKESEAE
jgi:hypothetical protein